MIAAFLCVLVSATAFAYLAATDSKRRRAFRLEAWQGRRWSRTAWLLALVPGVLLLAFGTAAAFVVWLGTVTVLGWRVAALEPTRTRSLATWFNRKAERLWRYIPDRWRQTGLVSSFRSTIAERRRLPARLDILEQRIADLEARLPNAGKDMSDGSANRRKEHPIEETVSTKLCSTANAPYPPL